MKTNFMNYGYNAKGALVLLTLKLFVKTEIAISFIREQKQWGKYKINMMSLKDLKDGEDLDILEILEMW